MFGVSVLLRVSGAAGGVLAGGVAVWLAQTIPGRMELEERTRPWWWWGTAILIGALYGWQVTSTVPAGVVPAYLVFGAATLGLALIDLDHQLIPNRVLFPSLGVGFVLLAVGAIVEGDAAELLRGVGGGVTYFVVLLAIGLLARGGFGMGDVKLAFLLGLFLGFVGWGELAVGALLAILLGGVASILLLVLTKRGRRAKFAYGPYLVAGAWAAVLWGEPILDWYLGAGS
jgi:leader peptidase (prepilin peptidase)/N-methyltransferase